MIHKDTGHSMTLMLKGCCVCRCPFLKGRGESDVKNLLFYSDLRQVLALYLGWHGAHNKSEASLSS